MCSKAIYNQFKRGDIFYADLSPVVGSELGGIRPVVIIQNDVGNKYSPLVIIAPITAQIKKRKFPTYVEISREEYGFDSDSVIMLDQIRTLDKIKLKEKIGNISNARTLEDIDKALGFSLNIKHSAETIEVQQLKEYISQMTKPLVLTEGKTDTQLINTAWEKLYPHKEMFFECMASGLEADNNKKQGSAETVRRTIEFWSTIAEKSIIGLFDNDREGNEQFKGLSDKIFEKHDIKKDSRKHNNTNVWGLLLPVPEERKIFVTDNDITQRYFVIEHYFSDDILKKYHLYGNNILETCVFKVTGKNKDKFSKEVANLDAKEFENFKILFSKIGDLFNLK